MFEFRAGNEVGYDHDKPVARITHTLNRSDIIALLTIAGKAYGQEDLRYMFTASPLGGQIIKGLEAEIASSEKTREVQYHKVKRLEAESNTLYQQLKKAKAELEHVRNNGLVEAYESRSHVFESPSVIVNQHLRAELANLRDALRASDARYVSVSAELQDAKAEAAKYKAMATQEVIEMGRKLTQGIAPNNVNGAFYCSVPGSGAQKVKHSDINTALAEAKRLCNGPVKVVQVFRLEYTVTQPTYEGGLFNITKSEA